MTYTEEDCINALQNAKDKIGSSPTMSEYDELDIGPSSMTIRRLLGGWNKAKDKANLDKIPKNEHKYKGPRLDKPEDFSSEEWRNMTSNQRHYYHNKKDILAKNRELKNQKQEWFKNYKKDIECENCGENHPATLSFHHRNPEEKEHCVSKMPANGYSIESIKQEMEKCDVLCRNCHAIKHKKGL